MVNLVFFGGVALCLGLLLGLALGLWRLLGRSVTSLLIGLAVSAMLAIFAGPYVFIALMALTFAASDADRHRSEPEAVVARVYERPAELPPQISHRFSVEITLRDDQGNRSAQAGEVLVTLVHDPRAADGIGDGHLWQASGTPLSFDVGPHRGVSRWDARKIVDQCLLRWKTIYPDYGKLYAAMARLYGDCHSFIGAQFVTVDGKGPPSEWPEGVKVAIARLTTTGALAADDPAVPVVEPTAYIRR